MTLPLIVVPAIALLRPADKGGSLISSFLSASDDASDEEASGDDLSGFSDASDDFDALFGGSSDDDSSGEEVEPFQEDGGDSLVDDFTEDFSFDDPPSFEEPSSFEPARPDPPPRTTQAAPTASEERLLQQLTELGAARTLWFQPAQDSVGFVAFFEAGVVTYRFSAISTTREAALQNVISQARRWLASRQP